MKIKKLLSLLIMCVVALGLSAETVVTFVAGTDKGKYTGTGAAPTSGDEEFSKDGVTIKATASAFAAAQYRLFKNQKMTISSSIGAITKIVVTSTASGTSQYGPGLMVAEAGTYDVSDKVGTWIGSATEVVFTASQGQVRMTKIEVTVGGSAGDYVAKPVFTPAAGTFYEAQSVQLKSNTEGANIFYTLDGSDPSASSTAYSTPIAVSATTTIKAIAIKGEKSSDIAEGKFEILTPIEVANIAEYNEADDEEAVKFTSPVTVLAHNAQSTYVMDDSGYALIYGDKGQTYQNGDVIPAGFVGMKTPYNGRPELVAPLAGFQAPSSNSPVAPELIQVVDVDETMWGHYVLIKGATLKWNSETSSASTISDNSGEALAHSGMGGFGSLTDATKVYDVYAVIGSYQTQAMAQAGEPVKYRVLPVKLVDPSTGDDPSDTGVASIAEFKAYTGTDPVAFKNPVTTLAQSGSRLFVKDNSGYMLIYGNVGQSYERGAVIPAGFKGKPQKYNGEIQLSSPSGFQASTSSVQVVPEEITTAAVVAGNYGHLVKIKSVTIDASAGTLTDAAGSASYYNNMGANLPSDLTKKYDVIGIIGSHGATNTVYQVLPLVFELAPYEVDQVEVDGVLYSLLSDNTAIVIKNSSDDYHLMTCVQIHPTISYDNEDYVVTSVAVDAFDVCDNLNTLLLSGNGDVQFGSIGSKSSAIKTLCIEDGITSIEGLLLNPTDIYCYSSRPATCDDHTFIDYSSTLHVPSTAVANYFVAPYWEYFANVVGDAIEPTEISFEQNSKHLLLNEQAELSPIITPENAMPNSIQWLTTNNTIAVVDNGIVSAIGVGECDIIANVVNKSAICHVTVSYPEITLVLNEEELSLNLADQASLTATITPDNLDLTPTWSSSDNGVATVTNGVVTAVGEGECDIIVAVLDKTATCHVIVNGTVTIWLDLSNATIAPNQILTLYPSCTPDVEVDLTVDSSDPRIAVARIVNRSNAPSYGAPVLASTKAIQVVGISDGDAIITVGSADGKAEPATIDVYVRTVTDIHDIHVARSASNQRYNVLGQPVDDNYHGIVIENGRKIILR